MTADMSVAPEIARLAEPMVLVPAQSAAPPRHPAIRDAAATTAPQLTLGALAGLLRSIAATPERWWGLVRFDPGRSVKIMIEESASHVAWLVVLPPGDSPGDAGHGCDCDVVTMIAGEAFEGTPGSAVLRPGPVRVHGRKHKPHAEKHGTHDEHGQHGLHGRGPGYSISLHARAHLPAVNR